MKKKILNKEIDIAKKSNAREFIIINNISESFENLVNNKFFDKENYNFVIDENYNINQLINPIFQSNCINTNTEVNSKNSITILTLVDKIYSKEMEETLYALLKMLTDKFNIDTRNIVIADDIINNKQPYYLCGDYSDNFGILLRKLGLKINNVKNDASDDSGSTTSKVNSSNSGKSQSKSVYAIDDLIGKIGEKYNVTNVVHGMQTDPSIRTNTNFKQEYTVVIRKKKYYSINALEGEDAYIRMYQVDNFTSLSTSIDCNNAGSGSCSVTIAGNTRLVCAEREQQDTSGWANFDEMLNGWSYEIDDNDTVMTEKGDYLYNNIVYDNINDLKRAKYGWRIAEKCDFEPMDEIHVYGKSRSVKENGKFKVFKIFFGYITDVTKSYSAGKTCPSITIKATDHCKLLDISYIASTMAHCYLTALAGAHYDTDYAGNIIIDDNITAGDDDPAIGPVPFTNVFAGRYPYEIIQKCATDAGIPEKYLTTRIEKIKRVPFMPQQNSKFASELFTSELKSRLSFCKTAAEKLLVEFFADEEGNLVLKIPNWTLGVNQLPANNCYINQYMTDEEKSWVDAGGVKTFTTKKYVSEDHVITDTIEEGITHTVARGDTLWDLARTYLGDSTRWPEIYNLNTNIVADPHWIYPGQALKIKIGKTSQRTETIQKEVEETTTQEVTMSSITDKYIPEIRDDEIVSFTICDSDKNIANCFTVKAEVPFIDNQTTPLQTTRAIQDWGSIIRFGFRFENSVDTPLLNSEVTAVMFGTMLVAKAASKRYSGSMQIIEDSAIRVGDPIRTFIYDEHPYKFNEGYEKESKYQAIFYVEKIDRSISPESVSLMTLTLSAGRVMGMESIYDKMKLLYSSYFEEPEIVVSRDIPDLSGSSSSASDSGSGSGVTVNASGKAKDVLDFAQTFLGIPYTWGGKDPSTGFDCSGFVAYVFNHFGYNLTAYTHTMKNEAKSISTSSLQPADIVFFNGFDHVGIFIGDDTFIHAHGGPNKQGLPNYKVELQSLSGYYTQPCGAIRPL